MNILEFLVPPIMGSIIALSTNWLAIRMLFRPHAEKRIFGIRIPFTPGLIPRERERLTKKLSEAVSTRLLTPDVLSKELSDPSLWPLPDITVGEALSNWGITDTETLTAPIANYLKSLTEKLTENLLPKLTSALKNLSEAQPELDAKLAELTRRVVDENVGKFAGMFVSKDKVYTSIKEGIITYLSDEENHNFIKEKIHTAIDTLLTSEQAKKITAEKLYTFHIRNDLTALLSGEKQKHAIERVLSILAKYLAQHMPIQTIIENRISAFNVAEAEELIISVAGRELKIIIWLGGVLGFIIGLFVAFV